MWFSPQVFRSFTLSFSCSLVLLVNPCSCFSTFFFFCSLLLAFSPSPCSSLLFLLLRAPSLCFFSFTFSLFFLLLFAPSYSLLLLLAPSPSLLLFPHSLLALLFSLSWLLCLPRTRIQKERGAVLLFLAFGSRGVCAIFSFQRRLVQRRWPPAAVSVTLSAAVPRSILLLFLRQHSLCALRSLFSLDSRRRLCLSVLCVRFFLLALIPFIAERYASSSLPRFFLASSSAPLLRLSTSRLSL